MPSQFLPIRQCPHNACSWVHYAIGGLVITGCIYVCLHVCMCVSQSMLYCHSTRVFDVCKRPKITFYLNKSNKYWSATWSSMFLVKTIIAINKTLFYIKFQVWGFMFAPFMKREISRESLRSNSFSRWNAKIVWWICWICSTCIKNNIKTASFNDTLTALSNLEINVFFPYQVLISKTSLKERV